MKKKIVIVGDYNRSDFLLVARLIYKEADVYFIEYLNESYLTSNECLKYGDVLYWKNFSDAYDLLEKIKPDKIIFYFLETYNHVALNVACKVKQVPTYHLEHGLRFSLSFYKAVNNKFKESIKSTPGYLKYVSKFNELANIRVIYDKYRNRQFFKRTQFKSPLAENHFLGEFFKIRSQNIIFDTFQQLKSSLRLPDSYISFSPIIFNYHKVLENLPDAYPVSFIGIPQFDPFFQWRHLSNAGNHILFIDQPFHEQQIYGWTRKDKELFLTELAHRAKILNRKLYIKPHPYNEQDFYSKVLSTESVELVIDEWEKVVPEINTVLGFSSALLLPFMAMDHIACFTLEIHPQKIQEPYSQFLLDSEACHAASSFDDLFQKLNEREYWYIEQSNHKELFIEKYMYKFDGEASKRLKSILLDEVS
jgi:hypothetical protein